MQRGTASPAQKTAMLYLLLLLAALLLAGCSTAGLAGLKGQVADVKADVAGLREQRQEAVADLREFTLTDLQAALATATRGGDTVAMACFPALIAKVQRAQAAQQGPPAGLVDAFERLRLIIRPPGGHDDTIALACAALKDQITRDILKFEATIAGIAASGGLSGIASVPDALKAAPKVLQLLRSLGAGGP